MTTWNGPPCGGNHAANHSRMSSRTLVVIGMVAFLAGMLLPALSKAKAKAQGIQCVGNMKHPALAWVMYADDHAGRLPLNHSYIPDPPHTKWAYGFIQLGQPDWPDNTNTVYLRDGLLGLHLGGNISVYKCPGDGGAPGPAKYPSQGTWA